MTGLIAGILVAQVGMVIFMMGVIRTEVKLIGILDEMDKRLKDLEEEVGEL